MAKESREERNQIERLQERSTSSGERKMKVENNGRRDGEESQRKDLIIMQTYRARGLPFIIFFPFDRRLRRWTMKCVLRWATFSLRMTSQNERKADHHSPLPGEGRLSSCLCRQKNREKGRGCLVIVRENGVIIIR